MFKKIALFTLDVFCLFILVELCVNYFAFYYLFPIKDMNSYGYITRKNIKTVIPLGKYNSRLKAQIALPYELIKSIIETKKELNIQYDKVVHKYGYVDNKGKLIIDYKFDIAQDFYDNQAIVAISIKNKLKFGTIDKNGNWVIQPKYEHLCPFFKYHTRACIDKNHCGVIDRYGNEITLMSYSVNKIKRSDYTYREKFCTTGEKKQAGCNYFL